MRVALQLYTIRDKIAADYRRALRKVAEIGYKAVEYAGHPFLTVSADELRSLMEELNLRPVSAHVPYNLLRSHTSRVLEYASKVGLDYLVSEPDVRKISTRAEAVEVAEEMSELGREIAGRGMRFCMHNHAVQFEKRIGGKPVYMILVEESDPRYVHFQLDTYWVKYAGYNPVEVLRALKGRCPLIHLKDMRDEESREMTELGRGIINFREIVEVAERVGVEWYIVENDRPTLDSLESARVALMYLRSAFTVE